MSGRKTIDSAAKSPAIVYGKMAPTMGAKDSTPLMLDERMQAALAVAAMRALLRVVNLRQLVAVQAFPSFTQTLAPLAPATGASSQPNGIGQLHSLPVRATASSESLADVAGSVLTAISPVWAPAVTAGLDGDVPVAPAIANAAGASVAASGADGAGFASRSGGGPIISGPAAMAQMIGGGS